MNTIKNTLFALILSLIISSVCAQNIANSDVFISLRSGDFTLHENDGRLIFSHWPSFNGQYFGLIKLEKNIALAQQHSFEDSGIKFLESFRKGCYLISVSDTSAAKTLFTSTALATLPWSENMKWLNKKESIPSRAKQSRNRVLVNLHPFASVRLAELLTQLPANKINIIDVRETYGFVTIACPVAFLSELAAMNCIQYIDWKYDFGAPENYTARTSHRVNYLSGENSLGINYEGQGVAIMLQDDGSLGPHIDRQGREIQFLSVNEGDHGDHVSGTIVGAGNIDPKGKGMAPQSDLFVYKAAPEYQGFDSIASHYLDFNIVISSTSYSNGCNAGYTALTRTMDDQISQMPALMHVFSAGNSGTSNCGYGAGSNWGNITGGHKMGKNVITVANLTENDIIASSSSRGPANDGRIKPDISAKGTAVYSTLENYSYGLKTGTSMSCPGVSGSLAVLYSAYQGFYNTAPNSGLIKSIVLNTADDLGASGPDFIYGWGRINARKAFETIENGMYTSDTVADSDSTLISLYIPANLNRAKIMLYWVDPKASIGASTALINDLDLSISDPSNNIFLPLVLDPTPNAATLSNAAIPGIDHLNNMEQVVINDPTEGTYTVKVKGFDIPQGPQSFFLVHWFEEKKLELTYPLGGESFVPFSSEKIRWDIEPDTGTILLEYSANNGLSWNTINTVNAGQKYYDWSVPNISTGELIIRLSSNFESVESEKLSAISTPAGLSAEFVCPDSIGLVWSSVASASSYDIYRLGNKYMDSIGVSTTTKFVDYGQNPYSDFLWYSVSSNGADNAEGKRAIAYKISPGLYNCTVSIDAEVESLSPDNGSLPDCHGDSINVSFKLGNIGSTPISTIVAQAQINNATITETFYINLAPGNNQILTFSQSLPLTATSGSLLVSAAAAGDGNPFNDTLSVFIERKASQTIDTAVWQEDFEDFALCNTTANCGGEVCSLNGFWINEQNGTTDDIDWRINNGDTPSDFTGPTADHTIQTSIGKYLYLEASGSCDEATALLLSPCIKLEAGTKPKLKFWYHMRGADMGELHVDLYDGTQWYLDVTPALTGQQGIQWLLREVDLSDFAGNIVNVRFRGITGIGYRSDMALDDISVLKPPVANFTANPQPFNTAIDLVDLSINADSMVFSLGDGTILASVPSSYVYNQMNNYVLEQQVYNAAGADTMQIDLTNLNAHTLTAKPLIEYYPNPAIGSISFNIGTLSFDQLQVTNAQGEIVVNMKLTNQQNITLDLKPWSNGVYFAKFSGIDHATVSFIKTE